MTGFAVLMAVLMPALRKAKEQAQSSVCQGNLKGFSLAVAAGVSADHYRWGWEEKEEAGGSLVSPDPEHRYNLPEGLEYEHEGIGLKPAEKEGSG